MYDNAIGNSGAWRGFLIFGAGPVATPTPVPTLTGHGIAAPLTIVGLFAMFGLRRRPSV